MNGSNSVLVLLGFAFTNSLISRTGRTYMYICVYIDVCVCVHIESAPAGKLFNGLSNAGAQRHLVQQSLYFALPLGKLGGFNINL